MLLLKCKLMEGIENQLRDRVADEEQKSQVAVADINFKYQNGWLLDLLTKRGDAIKWKDWDALTKINTQLRHQCTAKRQDLISPTDAFVTFENEITVNLARERPTVDLLGQSVAFKQALEPTDIIWEHANFDVKTNRKWKIAGLLVYCLVLLMFNFAT